MKRIIFLFVFFFLCQSLYAQTIVAGRVIDAIDNAPVVGAVVSIQSEHDTTKKKVSTDENGNFSIANLYPGKYILSVFYPGYSLLNRNIVLKTQAYFPGNIKLHQKSKTLQTVIVKERQIRGQQSGDTTQFNADAFKVHPDANAEDLIKKMPGITSDNNGLKANGEEIKKVLVDGKPFFGDDPNAALKNLPAETVDKIQIFDNQSDQANFTGFRDANTQKALNIVTKTGKRVGQFGRLYGGYGTNNRYQTGGNINFFKNVRRISLLGLSNNVNQQNFSISDIMNVMSNSGNQGGGAMGMPPPNMTGNSSGKTSGNTNTSSGPGALLTGQQSGITATQSVGINYSDSWGKNINISGSYFFNYTNNNNQTELVRKYFTDTALSYTENGFKQTFNQNHRLNLRMEYSIDADNALIFTPKFTFQHNKYNTALNAYNAHSDNGTLGTTDTHDSAKNSGYNFSNSVLYQHKFHKKGRTVSLNVATELNDRNGSGAYNSMSTYGNTATISSLDQRYTTESSDYLLSGTLSYTEPIGAHSQLMYSYTPSYSNGDVNKETKNKDSATHQYSNFDTSLSNRYNKIYGTHKNGLSYKYQRDKLNFSAGADVQVALLKGAQEFPTNASTSRSFNSILPSASLNYRISKTENIFINYLTATNAPSLTQLQNVTDVSNPLQLSSGNPQLDQTYEHTFLARYGKTNISTARNLFVFAMASYVSDYISNATFIPSSDTLINNYQLKRGSQLTLPINMNGYWSAKSFAVYSLPLSFIKSNFNLNAGLTCNRTPAIINNITNYSSNWIINTGFYLGSNISSNLDFSFSYNGNYNIVKNTVQTQSDNKYYSHNTNFKINWILPTNFVLGTDVTHSMYLGSAAGFDQDFFLWNASVGYKLLKNKALEAKIYAFDILNQNRSISRSITETYTQDSKTNILTHYAMLSFTYTIRNFKNGGQVENTFSPPPGMPPPPRME
jgi:hypothetical protein